MGIVNDVKRVAGRPIVLDLLLAIVLSWAVMKKAAEHGVPSTGDVLVALVAFVAVLLRRILPGVGLGIATAAGIGAILAGVNNPGIIAALGVITFSISAYTGWRRGWACACISAGALYLTGVLRDPTGWWSLTNFGIFAWIFLAAAVGDATRHRHAYIAEVEERARRAERTREEEARRRVTEERLRIARDLHDVVAHHIAVISVQAGAAAHVLERRPEQVAPVLATIREASDNVLKEIQSVIGVLRSTGEADSSTEPAPGLGGLPELVSGLEGPAFRVRSSSRGQARPLPAVADLAAYRIVQEALTNAHRYGAGSASLTVEYSAPGVTLEVCNEIRPLMPQARPGPGYGLLGMRERAASAGGEVTAGPLGDGRFRVRAFLPAPAPAPAPLSCRVVESGLA